MDSEIARMIIQKLNLQPLPGEGGLFLETYHSTVEILRQALPTRYRGARRMGTAIYFALTGEDDSFSAMHRLATDEIYHFYLGDPVEFLLLFEDGASQRVLLGSDLLAGQAVQFVVPADTWQGSRLLPGGAFALMGTTMAPGFTPDDFTLGQCDSLQAGWPAEAGMILRLTRN